MPTEHPPFYLDWSFWTMVFAGIAIVLSQLPPLHLLFKPAALDVELFSWVAIMHKVGNPNIQIHLIFNNIGGRSLRVRGAKIAIKRDGKEIVTLPAQNYLQNPNDSATVLFTPFSLRPKEEWAHIINFLNYFPRADNQKYRKAESAIKADIFQKKSLPGNKDKVVEADAKNILVFMDMFNSNFIWQSGEYEASVSIETSPQGAAVKKSFRFTLFESDSNDLSKVRDDYKFGDGIYFDSGNHPGIVIQINEIK